MHAFEEVARPVIFEHNDNSFPCWGKGSSMLLDAEQNTIHHDQARIESSRVVIRAIYHGTSSADHCCMAQASP